MKSITINSSFFEKQQSFDWIGIESLMWASLDGNPIALKNMSAIHIKRVLNTLMTTNIYPKVYLGLTIEEWKKAFLDVLEDRGIDTSEYYTAF